MREKVIESVEREKLIVIVRGVEKEKLLPLSEALFSGGIRLLEITYSAQGNVSDGTTAENIKMLSEHFKGRMHIGAGTVLTEKQAELTKKAGGEFIISPDACGKVIKRTRELEMVSMPGALTPSEIRQAHEDGADLVKLFPASAMGAEYIKAVRAPLSHIKLLAVGGISCSNMKEYLKAGAAGFGVGSNIIDKDMLDAGAYGEIRALAEKYVRALKENG